MKLALNGATTKADLATDLRAATGGLDFVEILRKAASTCTHQPLTSESSDESGSNPSINSIEHVPPQPADYARIKTECEELSPCRYPALSISWCQDGCQYGAKPEDH